MSRAALVHLSLAHLSFAHLALAHLALVHLSLPHLSFVHLALVCLALVPLRLDVITWATSVMRAHLAHLHARNAISLVVRRKVTQLSSGRAVKVLEQVECRLAARVMNARQ